LDFLDKDQGQLIFDVQLVMVVDDEGDRGFYSDTPVTQEEVRKLALRSIKLDKEGRNLLDKVENPSDPSNGAPENKAFQGM
jgi:hypothetical protein